MMEKPLISAKKKAYEVIATTDFHHNIKRPLPGKQWFFCHMYTSNIAVSNYWFGMDFLI